MPKLPKYQELLKNDFARGAALGAGAALIAAAALPVVFTAARPLVRSAVKSGLLLLEMGREAVAEAGENFEDLVAEVKAEMAERQGGMAAAEVVQDSVEVEG